MPINQQMEANVIGYGVLNVFVFGMIARYRDVLLEESDSESDGDQTISEQDLRILLKIHRTRRKYQKKYHTDPTVFKLFSLVLQLNTSSRMPSTLIMAQDYSPKRTDFPNIRSILYERARRMKLYRCLNCANNKSRQDVPFVSFRASTMISYICNYRELFCRMAST